MILRHGANNVFRSCLTEKAEATAINLLSKLANTWRQPALYHQENNETTNITIIVTLLTLDMALNQQSNLRGNSGYIFTFFNNS